MAKSRDFDLSDVLSITTGSLVSSRHMDGIYDILNFMTGDNLSTIALIRASEVCKPIILDQYPQLRNLHVPDFRGNVKKMNAWVAEQKQKFGNKLSIKALPSGNWQSKNVIDEAIDLGVDPNKIIVVDPSKPDFGLGKPNT